jgi:hypothetical protein
LRSVSTGVRVKVAGMAQNSRHSKITPVCPVAPSAFCDPLDYR